MNFSSSSHLSTVLGGALVFLIALAVLPTVIQQFNQSKVLVANDAYCLILGERATHMSETKDDFTGTKALALTQQGSTNVCELAGGTASIVHYTPNGRSVTLDGSKYLPTSAGEWKTQPLVLKEQVKLNTTIVNLLPLVILVAGLLAAGGWIYNARRSSA